MDQSKPTSSEVKAHNRKMKKWAKKLGETGWTPQTSKRIADVFISLSYEDRFRKEAVLTILSNILEGR